jgi:hypothetical protein
MNTEPCAALSLRLEESLAGTAVVARHWLILEVDAPWAPKAIDSPRLSPRLRRHLEVTLAAASDTRLQLVRRPGTGDGRVSVMAVVVGGPDPRIHEWAVASLDSVCEIDIAAAWSGAIDAPRSAGPLVLVCTHGRRDVCCAKAGMPVFQALTRARPEAVWQTTHLGGHRFAANAVVLPAGVQYGRVQAEHVPRMIASMDAGRIMSIAQYRGRTDLSRSAQAAAISIRAATGEMRAGALCHQDTQRDTDHVCIERFDLDGTAHARRVVSEMVGTARPFSCGDPPDRVPTVHRIASARDS